MLTLGHAALLAVDHLPQPVAGQPDRRDRRGAELDGRHHVIGYTKIDPTVMFPTTSGSQRRGARDVPIEAVVR